MKFILMFSLIFCASFIFGGWSFNQYLSEECRKSGSLEFTHYTVLCEREDKYAGH